MKYCSYIGLFQIRLKIAKFTRKNTMDKTLEQIIQEAVTNAVTNNLQANTNTSANLANPEVEIESVDSQSLETNASSGS